MRPLIFWTYLFPIVLSLFFYMAFSKLGGDAEYEPVPVAVVLPEQDQTGSSDSQQGSAVFLEHALEQISQEGSSQVFAASYVAREEAETMLEDGTVSGIIVVADEPEVIFRENGIDQTVIKSVVDQIEMEMIQISEMVYAQLGEADYSSLNASQIAALFDQAVQTYTAAKVNIQDVSGEHINVVMVEFYTLMAMVCIYGGCIAQYGIDKHLPNMSGSGKRTSISCCSKSSLLFSSFLASWIVQLTGLVLLYAFLRLVLKIDFGTRPAYVALLTLTGSLAGTCLGIFLECALPLPVDTKDSILILVTLILCFFSGMMGVNFKYFFDQNAPLLNRLNPVAMITDGYYALYSYPTLSRFRTDLFSLLIFSGLLLALSAVSMRRLRYDSL